MFTAGIATDTSTRDMFISDLHKFISNGINEEAFADWYETTDGSQESFTNRPVAGGHLALVSFVVLCSWCRRIEQPCS